jgi:hypothetical protein
MFSSSPLDWLLIALYFGLLAFVWLRRFGARPENDDYFVAGRAVTNTVDVGHGPLPGFLA